MRTSSSIGSGAGGGEAASGRWISGFSIGRKVGVGRHAGRRIEADALAHHARDDQRDAPPVRRRPAGVGCPVRQDHVTLALASLRLGLAAVVAD